MFDDRLIDAPSGATLAPFTKPEKPQLCSRFATDFIKNYCRNSNLADLGGGRGRAARSGDGRQKGALVANFVDLLPSSFCGKTARQSDRESPRLRDMMMLIFAASTQAFAPNCFESNSFATANRGLSGHAVVEPAEAVAPGHGISATLPRRRIGQGLALFNYLHDAPNWLTLEASTFPHP